MVCCEFCWWNKITILTSTAAKLQSALWLADTARDQHTQLVIMKVFLLMWDGRYDEEGFQIPKVVDRGVFLVAYNSLWSTFCADVEMLWRNAASQRAKTQQVGGQQSVLLISLFVPLTSWAICCCLFTSRFTHSCGHQVTPWDMQSFASARGRSTFSSREWLSRCSLSCAASTGCCCWHSCPLFFVEPLVAYMLLGIGHKGCVTVSFMVG